MPDGSTSPEIKFSGADHLLNAVTYIEEAAHQSRILIACITPDGNTDLDAGDAEYAVIEIRRKLEKAYDELGELEREDSVWGAIEKTTLLDDLVRATAVIHVLGRALAGGYPTSRIACSLTREVLVLAGDLVDRAQRKAVRLLPREKAQKVASDNS